MAFITYIAIITPDSRTCDLLTYARLIMREARRAGGNGWLTYDSAFCQNAAVLLEVSWTTLDPSLHAATFLAFRSREGKHCALCGGSDHQAEDCALAPLSLQAPSPGGSDKPPGPAMPKVLSGWSSLWICESWNRGRCSFPGSCSYKHWCLACFRAGTKGAPKSVPASGTGLRHPHCQGLHHPHCQGLRLEPQPTTELLLAAIPFNRYLLNRNL